MEKEKKEKLFLMLDIETLGKEPGCIVTSFAIESFMLPNVPGGTDIKYKYNAAISVVSSLLFHFTTDYDTEEWWNAPERAEARKKLLSNDRTGDDIRYVLPTLYADLTALCKKYDVWFFGRGVGAFDLPILSEAMRRVVGEDYKCPWDVKHAVDVRSIVNFFTWSGMQIEQKDAPHNAIDDVIKQINEIEACWACMNKGNPLP